MTGPEHYREAEKHIGCAFDAGAVNTDIERVHLTYAQVHATLALAAATGLNDAEHGFMAEDFNAWHQVAATPEVAS